MHEQARHRSGNRHLRRRDAARLGQPSTVHELASGRSPVGGRDSARALADRGAGHAPDPRSDGRDRRRTAAHSPVRSRRAEPGPGARLSAWRRLYFVQHRHPRPADARICGGRKLPRHRRRLSPLARSAVSEGPGSARGPGRVAGRRRSGPPRSGSQQGGVRRRLGRRQSGDGDGVALARRRRAASAHGAAAQLRGVRHPLLRRGRGASWRARRGPQSRRDGLLPRQLPRR